MKDPQIENLEPPGFVFRVVQKTEPAYRDLVELRRQILRIPLGLDLTPEQLSQEKEDIPLGVFEPSFGLIAGLLLRPLNGSRIKMRQVAVGQKFQRKGIGKHLVKFAEQYATEHGFHEIELHARATVVGFYRLLGYKTEGGIFTEVGLAHVSMRKALEQVLQQRSAS